MIEEEIKPT